MIKFVPSLIAVRFCRRIGATDKIAIATASWAVTAALTGAMLLSSCLSHHRERQLQHTLPDSGRKNLPEERDVLVGQTLLAVIVQVPPHFVETFTFFVAEAFGFFRDRQEPARQVDCEELWVFSILLPIGVQDFLGDVGRQ